MRDMGISAHWFEQKDHDGVVLVRPGEGRGGLLPRDLSNSDVHGRWQLLSAGSPRTHAIATHLDRDE